MPEPGTPLLRAPPWRLAILRLALLSAACVLVLTAARLHQAWTFLTEASLVYDLRYDPIVVEKGELRVEGPRVPSLPAGPIYVDPEGKLDLTKLSDPALVLHKTAVLQVQGGASQSWSYDELLKGLEVESLRLDSHGIAAFQANYGADFLLGIGVGAAFVGVSLQAATLAGIVGFTALLVLRLAPFRALGWSFWARRAATTALVLPPLWLAFDLAGLGTNPCLDLFVYPWLLSTLVIFQSRPRPREE